MIIDLDFDNAQVGDQVKTENGFLWTKEGPDSWTDVNSGLTWTKAYAEYYNHSEALALETDEYRLPTRDEFEEAENHGLRRVMSGSTGSRPIWSSTLEENSDNSVAYAYFFNRGFCAPVGIANPLGAVRLVKR